MAYNRPLGPRCFRENRVDLQPEEDPCDMRGYVPNEGNRFVRNKPDHSLPEWAQSGALPNQPEGLEVNATGETRKAFRSRRF